MAMLEIHQSNGGVCYKKKLRNLNGRLYVNNCRVASFIFLLNLIAIGKMKYLSENKDILNSVLSELKVMGIKVPKLKKIKINISKQDKGPNYKVFGVCLADQEGASGSNPPKFILSCTEYLRKYSKEIGLFRKAGSIARQKNLRAKLEKGGTLDGSEPNDVASLLKQWLRELPEPLLPSYLHDSFIRCQNLNKDNCISATLLLCLLIPPHHLLTLKHLMCFLAEIATDEAKNQMNVKNLALIMTPNIFVNSLDKSSNMTLFTSVIHLLIENAHKIGDIPPTLALKLPVLEEKCESGPHMEALQSSPSISRKQYLLRSFKNLVKQTTTSAASPKIVAPDNSSTLLRQTLSVNNIEKVCLKATAETKGNSNLFAPRNFDDVCKRSFRLLRRKDKRGLKPTMDCHPFTQSLEIESPYQFQKEVDKIKMYPSVQGPFIEDILDSGNFLAVNQFDDKHSGLEDIEMTTFSTHLNEQSNNLAAFPIPSFSQNLPPKRFLFESENEYNDKTCTEDLQLLHPKCKEKMDKCTNLHQNVGVAKPTEIPQDTGMQSYGHSTNNRDLHKSKSVKLVHNSYKVNEGKLLNVDKQNNFSNRKVDSFKTKKQNNSSLRGQDSVVINKVNKTQKTCLTAENEILPTSNVKVLNEKCSGDSNAFKVLREGTFVIEPTQNSTETNKIKRPHIDGHKCKRVLKNVDNKHDTRSNLSQKRPSTVSNNKKKVHNKNPPVKRVAKNSVGKTIVPKYKPVTSLQSTKNTVYVKGCSNLLNLDRKKEDSKIFVEATVSSSISKKQMQNNLPSCLVKDKFSETTASLPSNPSETSLISKRKLSFSGYPVTTASHSDSKIPRIRNTFDVSVSNSFCEEATGHSRQVSKPKPNTSAAGETPTRIPGSRNNLSTLDISINDSCFLTPNRNAMLSPNSVVWMSGNKYFDSNSPKEDTFNKRESIAMILKSNSGHVQAKVHLYDDLVRESVDASPTVPSHSTPTSKFRRLSSSQSLKSTPKRKINAENSKSASSKASLVNRSHSLRKEKSLKSYDPTKFSTHIIIPSPIKSNSLKDVTNTSAVFNESKNSHSNFQTLDENISNFDRNRRHPMKRRKPKGNSFSGNANRKFVKKVSRSESSPGCPRPFLRVSCLIQESNYEE